MLLSAKRRRNQTSEDDHIFIFRVLICFSLAITAAICGYGEYELVKTSNERLYNDQYDSAVQHLDSHLLTVNAQLTDASNLFSHFMSFACSPSTMWPICTVDPPTAFIKIAQPILPITNSFSVGYAPFVKLDQLSEFNSFACNFIENTDYYDSGTNALSAENCGVYTVNETSKSVNFNQTSKIGKYSMHVPVLQVVGKSSSSDMLYDLYSDPILVNAIDNVVDCVYDNPESSFNSPILCSAYSDVFVSARSKLNSQTEDIEFRPAGAFFVPIFSSDGNKTLVGTSVLSFYFDGVLDDAHTVDDNGLYVVVETPTIVSTFVICDNCETPLLGKGDLHDKKYNSFRREIDFPDSIPYDIFIYPSDLFAKESNDDLSNNPWIACAIVVIAVIFSSLIFFCYDYLVHHAAHRRDEAISNSKRQFISFISHEIRSPMNTGNKMIQNFKITLFYFNFFLETIFLSTSRITIVGR